METREEMFKVPRDTKNKKKKIFWWVSGFIVLMVLIFLLLTTSLGNTISHKIAPNVDTPIDRMVKSKVIDKINNEPNLSQRDKNTFVKITQKTPMSKVTNAAGNANDAATLLSEYTNKDKSTARDIINAAYSDSRLNQLRNDIAESKFLSAYREYNKLSQGNVLNEVITKSENNASNSAQKMQKNASKLYNQSIHNNAE